jgi:hypothetical protein
MTDTPCSAVLPDTFVSEPTEAKISLGLAAALARPSAATFGHASVVGIGHLWP